MCDSTLPSAFLQLPVELRDEIYSHVASNDPDSSSITFHVQPGPATPYVYHGLLYACKQTRQEYTQALLRYYGITATIENFDFQPFVAFLSELPGTFLASLPKQLAPLDFKAIKTEYLNPGARVIISIKMADSVSDALEGFRLWQVKQKSLEATGSRLQVNYEFVNRPYPQMRLGMEVLALAAGFDGSNDAITRAEILGTTRALVNGASFASDSDELYASSEGSGVINQIVRLYWNVADSRN